MIDLLRRIGETKWNGLRSDRRGYRNGIHVTAGVAHLEVMTTAVYSGYVLIFISGNELIYSHSVFLME